MVTSTRSSFSLRLLHEVVDLVPGGAHLYRRVQQAGGAHELLDHESAGFLEFVVGGGSAHVDLLACEFLELLELERAVVGGRGQAEAVVYEYRLAGVVTAVHRMYLRKGHVALVDEGYEVLGEVVDEAEGALALLAAVEVAGVVLDSGAVAHLLDHPGQ